MKWRHFKIVSFLYVGITRHSFPENSKRFHYNDVIMGRMASQITSLTIVYSTVYSDADQRKHQSSASLAFVRGIHRWPVNSPHKWPVTRKMFPFDDVIMLSYIIREAKDLEFRLFRYILCGMRKVFPWIMFISFVMYNLVVDNLPQLGVSQLQLSAEKIRIYNTDPIA